MATETKRSTLLTIFENYGRYLFNNNTNYRTNSFVLSNYRTNSSVLSKFPLCSNMRGKFKVTLTKTKAITSFIDEERVEFLFKRIGQLVRDREYKEIEIFNGEGKLIFTYRQLV